MLWRSQRLRCASASRTPVARLRGECGHRIRRRPVDRGRRAGGGEQPQQQRGIDLVEHLGAVGVDKGIGVAVERGEDAGVFEELQRVDERRALRTERRVERVDVLLRRRGVHDPVGEQADGRDRGREELRARHREQGVATAVERCTGAPYPSQRARPVDLGPDLEQARVPVPWLDDETPAAVLVEPPDEGVPTPPHGVELGGIAVGGEQGPRQQHPDGTGDLRGLDAVELAAQRGRHEPPTARAGALPDTSTSST